jgi:hypothetical protein
MDMTDKDTTYQYEVSLLDSFFEFHPDWFKDLSPLDREALHLYYAFGVDYYGADAGSDDVITRRDKAIAKDMLLQDRARSVLRRVLAEHGVDE